MTEIKGNPNAGLLGATLGFFFGFASVAVFGPAANEFGQLANFSPVMLGFLVAVPSLSGSLLRIPFASWVDTTGGRKPFLVLLLLSVTGMLGLFLVLVVTTVFHYSLGPLLYPVLLGLGILSGCGIATFSVGISQVSYWFPQAKQGSALGTYAGVGNLAPGLFSFLLPILLVNWGLSSSYLSWLIFLLIGTALYYRLGRNAWYFQLREQGMAAAEAKRLARLQFGQEIFPAGTFKDSLLISARVWKTWALVAIYFTTFGGFIALTAWLPTYWKMYFGLSAVTAGGLTALYSLLASVIRVAGGSVADRLGGENTAIVALLMMLSGGSVMAVSSEIGLSVSGVVLMGLGMGIANAAVFKLVPQEVPQAVGGAAGWVGGLGAFGGFAIPPVLALFVSAQGAPGYAAGFVVFVGLALTSLALAFTLKRLYVARGRAEAQARQ